MTKYTSDAGLSQGPPLAWARYYTERGWRCVPVPLGEKGPRERGWQEWRLTLDDLPRWFADGKHQIGILLGEPSQLVDIDLDCELAQRLAPHFLPPTRAQHGRQGRITHWWYLCRDSGRTIRRSDPSLTAAGDDKRLTLVELRGTGGQTLAPCGLPHPSGGQLAWREIPPEPAECDWHTLRRAVDRLAGACLLALRWREGVRHDLCLAVAGWLCKSGWSQDDAERFVQAVCAGAGDAEWRDRIACVRDTYQRHAQGEPVVGASGVAALLGDDAVVRALAEWLELERGDAAPARAAKRKAQRESDTHQLFEVARAAVHELFCDPSGRGYATLHGAGTIRLDSREADLWLARLAAAERIVPREQTLRETKLMLHAESLRSDPRVVHLRVAGVGHAVYIDGGWGDWRVIEATAHGWRVIPYADAPVRFWRTPHLRAMPEPVAGGSIDELRPYARLDEDDFMLLCGWLLGALHPAIPYPVLVIRAPQGSGKSTLVRLLRELVDPCETPHAAPPERIDDLMVAASQQWLLAFDNISVIPRWLSDALCRLSTGGGLSKRQLYTDDSLVTLNTRRPLILNGIRDLIAQPDLADRAIQIDLRPLDDEQRLTEQELLCAWAHTRGRVLGGVLDGLCHALRQLEAGMRIEGLPRMSDFAQLAALGVEAWGWTREQFLSAYRGNRADALAALGESSTLVDGIEQLMTTRDSWSGTASQLLAALQGISEEIAHGLPRQPHHLINRLRQEIPILRLRGIEYACRRAGRQGVRIHTLTREADRPTLTDADRRSASAERRSDSGVFCPRSGTNSDRPTLTDADRRSFSDPLRENATDGETGCGEFEENLENERLQASVSVSGGDFLPVFEQPFEESRASVSVSGASVSVGHQPPDPDLADLLASRRDGHALVAALWQWAKTLDFPSLQIESGTRVIGCQSGWMAFLRHSEPHWLERAALAAGL